MAYGCSLENYRSRKGTGGSNPSFSANLGTVARPSTLPSSRHLNGFKSQGANFVGEHIAGWQRISPER